MSPALPIPESLWDTVPPEAQAALMAVFESLRCRIAELDQRVADLEARLQLNPTNSSKPPSSDPIGLKRKPPAPPTGRKSGGQPGHARAQRPRVPPEKRRPSTDRRPATCRRRAHPLQGDDPEPLIRQVADLPGIEPIVDGDRSHRLGCPGCGATTGGTLPEGVPAGPFSPYTQAVPATLAGAYRLSKRQIRQLTADPLGLTISTGMISELEKQSAAALAGPYHESARSVLEAEAVNIDETGWREDRRKAWSGVTATALATVFTIARDRSAAVARRRLGDKEDQGVGSDRFQSYDRLWAYWRQVRWSHLRRDSRAMIDRGGPGERIGRRLLRLSDRLFEAWHQARDGAPEEGASQERVLRLRARVRRALGDGTRCSCATTARTCAEILRVEEGLWDVVWFPGVEPTNNAAGRALRPAVIRRRISGGTASESGSRFVERMLTVVATCRRQGRNGLESPTSCFEADRRGQSIPSLLPVTDPAIKVA